ncbi:deoxyribonuclease 1 like 4, tandem duplicate 1 [Denticeps clupeoides]|uniref:Deoxyribonuclease n=1 Tax=Denticeps clupeoides TaxID=299321 RepID=A0AAY4B3Z0_9TELE|nr:deoxyribonuclease gamma-like [Denticeps clupeoides]XP_028854458.1 deoxyribonuclease gamma-like [Denticeps clupeoides]
MKIASFNIQKFGKNKISDPKNLETIIKIICRYDIVVILEVVDTKGKAVDAFLKKLNSVRPYKMQISPRLGRGTYKEQYMILYSEDEVKLVDTYQYEDNQDGDEDAFAREPYILRFQCLTCPAVKDMVLIPVHTKPEDSEKELDELFDVCEVVKKKWKTDNIMMLGDFNADGAYVSKKDMKQIRIRTDPNFYWLIADDVDTTVKQSNDNTYDRIVVYGKTMLSAVVPESPRAFNFQKEYELTEEEALKISDHYPVELELKRKKNPR